MTFARLLDNTARRVPAKTALIDDRDQIWTYAAFAAMTRCAAGGLVAAGVLPGDRIALHMLNRVELAVLYFACARVGAIAVPVNTRLKPAEIDFVLQHSGATVYVGSSDLMPASLPGSEGSAHLRHVFALGEASRACPYAQLLANGPATSLPDIGASQPAVIIYTSGSTSRPKGVVYNHQAVVAGAHLGQPGITADRVVAQAASMMHSGGFCHLIASVGVGATFVLLPGFNADGVLDAIEQHRCTYFSGLPFMFDELVQRQRARPRDVTSATTFHAGGDTVSPALQERFLALFGHPLREGYGSTEAGRVTHLPPDRPVRTGSIGVPIDGIEVRIVDADGHDTPPEIAGELLIRSPAVMSGYWRDSVASAAALQNGWLRSGDLARRDADGYLWFVGRLKEIIVRGGSNVAPREVEKALADHPAVIESVVLGLPDDVLGERVVAVVCRRPEIEVTEGDLIAFLRERLADYKVPERISLRMSLPKNIGGKLARGLLREQLMAVPSAAVDW